MARILQAISALETALEDATMDADWARGTKEARHILVDLVKSSKDFQAVLDKFDNEEVNITLHMWSTTGKHRTAQDFIDDLKVIAIINHVLYSIDKYRTYMFSKDYKIKLEGKRKDVLIVVDWYDYQRL